MSDQNRGVHSSPNRDVVDESAPCKSHRVRAQELQKNSSSLGRRRRKYNICIAIPNFNMADSLDRLIGHLLRAEVGTVFVLDDASTDDSVELVRSKYAEVKMVQGDTNIGAAGNRNRILSCLTDEDLILFVDADIDIETSDLDAVLASCFRNDQVGLVGGQILTKVGKPMYWNYGPFMHPAHDFRVEVYEEVMKVIPQASLLMDAIRTWALSNGDTYNFEMQYGIPIARRVDWVSEAMFAVRTAAFRAVSGFDSRFRYHADQDLCLRLDRSGYEVWFMPEISGRHLEVDVRGSARQKEFRAGQQLFYEKHWGMSRDVFDRLYLTSKSE
jgi:GT2 family glycosyltransferase